MTLAQRIAELMKAESKMTPGEWMECGPSFGAPKPIYSNGICLNNDTDESEEICHIPEGEYQSADVSGIVALRNNALAIIDEQAKEVAQLREVLNDVYDMLGWHSDDYADEADASPSDMHAHINGLARQKCAKATLFMR